MSDTLPSRGTAKKFVAAAHFLEILSTFGTTGSADGVSESSNADKIRYSKWKAADIAKAFREGRKPTPGPAGGLEEELEGYVPDAPSINVDSAPEADAPLSPPPRPDGSSPSAISRDTRPPPNLLHLSSSPSFPPNSPSNPPPVNSAYLNPDSLAATNDPTTSGTWSTVATPGSPGVESYDPDEVVEGEGPTPTRKAWISSEMEGRNSDSDLEDDPLLNRPNFSQTTSATTAASDSSVVVVPSSSLSTTPAVESEIEDETFDITIITPPSVPSAPPNSSLPPGFVPSAPTQPPAPQIPSHVLSSHHPWPPAAASRPPPVVIRPADPEPEVILTPSLVSKTQRHCKFAMSALDYEDAETARRELRAALALLGG